MSRSIYAKMARAAERGRIRGGMPAGSSFKRLQKLSLSVTRLFNCSNPSESERFSKTEELMSL
jgi:hypothetical protein